MSHLIGLSMPFFEAACEAAAVDLQCNALPTGIASVRSFAETN